MWCASLLSHHLGLTSFVCHWFHSQMERVSKLGQYCLALLDSPQEEAYKHLFKGFPTYLALEEASRTLLAYLPWASPTRPISSWFIGHFSGLIENAQRHFQGSLFGCFEYVLYTAPTIVLIMNNQCEA